MYEIYLLVYFISIINIAYREMHQWCFDIYYLKFAYIKSLKCKTAIYKVLSTYTYLYFYSIIVII